MKFIVNTASSSNGELDVFWTRSNQADTYTVKYKLSTDSEYIVKPLTTSLSDTLTSLTEGVDYNVQVVAQNGYGIRESNLVTITVIGVGNSTTDEDTPTIPIPYNVNKLDPNASCSGAITATSSNTALVQNASIIIGGFAPACTVQLSPVANANGQAKITLKVVSGSLTVTSIFTLTVIAVNDPPTISHISNLVMDEDIRSTPITFSIYDVDSSPQMSCSASNISVSSTSNPTLIPGIVGADILISGTYPNCSATILPLQDQNGSANLVFRVTDNGAPGVPLMTDSNVFNVIVNPINDVPVISTITNKTTNEDTPIVVPFTIMDVDNVLTCSGSVSASSSVPAVLANSGIVIGGVAPNCTATLSPVANANNSLGTPTITISTTDGLLTAIKTFTLNVLPVNDAPTITAISAQSTLEDTAIGPIAFSINDIDSTVTCASVSGTSSNQSVVANAGIVITGSGHNCFATINPVHDANDTMAIPNITLTVSDGLLTATSIFALDVMPVNDAPVMVAIANQTTNEDIPLVVNVTISDVDNTLTCASALSKTTSNTSVLALSGIVIGGVAPNCTVTLSPVANANNLLGTPTVTLTVTDGLLTASKSFTLNVTPVNDAPTITTISAQSTLEDTSIGPITFTINDIDSTITCASVSGTSSNQSVVANAGIVIGGTFPNCTVTVTPVLNANNTMAIPNITLTVTDTLLTATSVFTLNITPVNDAPVMVAIANQTTNEDTPLVVNVTITDVDNTLTCASALSKTTSNSSVLALSGIVIGGVAPNCTATLTPVADANNSLGTPTVTLTVTDGLLTATRSFTLNVTPVNDAPTITTISSQSTLEDTTSGVIAFTVNDIDSTLTSCAASVSGTSANTAIVANAGIVIGGTYPFCTVSITPVANANGVVNITISATDGIAAGTKAFAFTVTPVNDAPVMGAITNQTTNEDTPLVVNFTISDVDNALTCATSVTKATSNSSVLALSGIVIGGIAPNCTATLTPVADANNSLSTPTVTLTVTDGLLTATRSFTLDVTPVNDAPTITTISSQSTLEDTTSGAIAFIVNDIDSTLTSCAASVSGTSANTAIVANAGIVIGGTYPNCTASITPVANANGVVNITISATDGIAAGTKTFAFTVTPVNDAPTISFISNETTNEDSFAVFSFTIADIDSVPNMTCSASNISVVSSSNGILLPGIIGTDIIIGGIYPNCTATIFPAANQNGSANIILRVTDNGSPGVPLHEDSNIFTIIVNPVNDAPTISSISAQIGDEDSAIGPIDFTINDIDSTISCASVTGTSSNHSIVANAGIVIGGTFPNCNVGITPIANANGVLNITLTVSDGSLTSLSSFSLTVSPVNDAPTISNISSQTTNEDTEIAGIAFTINDIDSALTCQGSVAGTSSDPLKVPNANIVISGTAPNCYAAITPASNQNGTVNITLTLTDSGTPLPGLTDTSVFDLNILAIPDLAGSLSMTGIASSYPGNTYARTLEFSALTSDEEINSVKVCLSRDSNMDGSLDPAELCNVQNWIDITSSIGAHGTMDGSTWTNFKMKNGSNGVAFTNTENPLRNSCSVVNTYFFSIKYLNASNHESNIITTAGWTFWEPSCLGSTLSQWLDATETSTIAIGSGVSSWTDKSGNNNSVTQAIAGNQPTYSASGLGSGYPGVIFDGVSNVLTGNSFVYDQGAASVLTVINGTPSTLTKYILSEGQTLDSSSNFYSPLEISMDDKLSGRIVDDLGSILLDSPITSNILFNHSTMIGYAEDSGSTYFSYVNGSPQSQSATTYSRDVNSLDTFALGANYNGGLSTSWMDATLGEIIITKGILSTANRNKLEGYTAHKWGKSTNLPNDHLYLNSPP